MGGVIHKEPGPRVAVHHLGELVDRRLLLGRELVGHVDHEPVADVAAALAAHLWWTLAPEPLDRAVLGAGRYAQALGSVERRHLDHRALDRLGDAQRHFDLEVLADGLEHRRVLHAGDHVQVARLAAAQPSLAFAGQPDAAAVAHAGRDVHAQLADRPLRAPAGAGGAGILAHRAGAVAVRARL